MITLTGIEHVNVDMKAMLAAIKDQQKNDLEKSIQNKQQTPVKTNTDTTHTVQHGDVVEMEDGTAAIYIDHQEELRKIQSVDKTRTKLINLATGSSVISDENQDVVVDTSGQLIDPGEKWLQDNPFDTRARDMREIKKGFSTLTYGIKGLVPMNSVEGKLVAEALEKVRSGEIILPTPEEYELQKQAAMKRKMERMQRLQQKAKEDKLNKQRSKKCSTKKKQQNPVSSKTTTETTLEEELTMASAPKYSIVQKGALEQLL